MKVSLNIIKQYTEVDLSVDELVTKINSQLGGVEEIIDLNDRYKDARIVRIVGCEKHENADKLNVCKVDDGGAVKDVPRDENGLVQVVCGAPNVKPDMMAVWLPPAGMVPSTADDDEPFILSARELRGVLSQGMLAAPDELAIGTGHDGILEITDNDLPEGAVAQAGDSFAKVFGLDDTIIDIENKMFTHRPDLFGQLGVAREIAGIQQKKFTSPEWYTDNPTFSNGEGLELDVFNDASEKVPRFMAVAIKGIEVKPSPLWLQCALVAMGSKPINNIVDITNYIMLITAQPTHAYDYDKLRGNKLGARMAKKGEKVLLLNDKEYELSDEDVVIADGEGPVGLAGIMGGGESEVSDQTKNIVLEVANFDMYTVRRSSMRYGLFTDALTRFNKGQSVLQNGAVLAKLIDLVGGVQASGVIDLNEFDDLSDIPDSKQYLKTILQHPNAQFMTTFFINDRLGLELSAQEITRLLENVEIQINADGIADSLEPEDSSPDFFSVCPPFWRTDIVMPEDVVEEVGRLYGFDKLPNELPQRSLVPAPRNKKRQLEKSIRNSLSNVGANELLTYSFVHERTLKAAGQNHEQAYRLSNAISPDLQFYRLSITPSLLEKVHLNIKSGYDEIALFEIGKAHTKTAELADGVPPEQLRAGFVYAAKNPGQGAPYYHAKRYLDHLAKELGLSLTYKPLPESKLPAAQPFDSVRRARVIDAVSGYPIAVIGEYTAKATKGFKLPAYAAGFELLTEGIQRSIDIAPVSHYQALSRYPSTSRDVTLRVGEEVTFSQLLEALMVEKIDEKLRIQIVPSGVYQSDGDEKKNITIHITITAADKTLTSNEASVVVDQLTSSANDILQSSVV